MCLMVNKLMQAYRERTELWPSDTEGEGDYCVKMRADDVRINDNKPLTVWWDLDGVLREIDKVGPGRNLDMSVKDYYHKSWDKVKEWLDDNPKRLQKLPMTEYARTIFKYYNRRDSKMRIITCQPNHWRFHTIKWIQGRTPNSIIYFTDTPKAKIPLITDNTRRYALVEDYPHFESYENVILVDRRYNKDVNAHVRVHSARELILLLEDIEHGYDPWETCKERREREESFTIYNRALQRV